MSTGTNQPHYFPFMSARPREVFLHPDDAMRAAWAWEDEQRAHPDPRGYVVFDALAVDARGCVVGAPVSPAYPTYDAAVEALKQLDPTREQGYDIVVHRA